MNDFKKPLSFADLPPRATPTSAAARFLSLRTKFSLFVSLVIILVCSGLSGYLINQEGERMKASLLNTGKMLVKTLSHVSRNRLIVQDTAYLQSVLEGTLSTEEVVYALVTDSRGMILASASKGRLTDFNRQSRQKNQPQFPDPEILKTLLLLRTPETVRSEPLISALYSFPQTPDLLLALDKVERRKGVYTPLETVFDFALPVYRITSRFKSLELLSAETIEDDPGVTESRSGPIGVIQVGITTAGMQDSLNDTVWQIGFITFGIILAGILLTFILANRIVNPLRRLAGAAEEIAEGKLDIAVTPDTEDEVGQLTRSINRMVQALHQRETSINRYVSTITKQVTQLSTLHQTSTAITATLDIEKLLSNVLTYLRHNLGFQRMVLVLHDAQRGRGIVREVSGVSKELEKQIRGMEFSLMKGDSMDNRILVEGKPTLVTNIEEVIHSMNPLVTPVLRQIRVTSFVVAPLRSQQRILGYLGGDKGDQPCIQEDLDLLVTVAGHVAVALDNARAYQDLEHSAENLERGVAQRTQELQAANERLLELDRLKSAFVSIVSHELRTPMTSIKGLVENMLDGLTGTMNERQTFYLDRVKHNIERLTRMINDLLDLSRIEAGRMELQRHPLNLGSIAREVVELFQTPEKESSLNFQTQIEDPLPLIQGDRDKLIQVLTNLVNNATRYTEPPGTITVSVSHPREGWVQACVSDTGPGISEENQRTLFEPFYRARANTPKNAGAGLGLAISKSLVELHGGRIWVESAVGQGSSFYFELPVPNKS